MSDKREIEILKEQLRKAELILKEAYKRSNSVDLNYQIDSYFKKVE